VTQPPEEPRARHSAPPPQYPSQPAVAQYPPQPPAQAQYPQPPSAPGLVQHAPPQRQAPAAQPQYRAAQAQYQPQPPQQAAQHQPQQRAAQPQHPAQGGAAGVAAPAVPQQRRAGQAPAEVRPSLAQPRFDLESTLSRQSVPWQAQVGLATAPVVEEVAGRPAQAPEGPSGASPESATRRESTAKERQRKALSHSLPQLHAGWHAVSAAMLKGLSGGGGATGLMLGVDYQRQPVPVRFFRSEATRVTLVGGIWAQRILVFRALALGARVIVMTSDQRPWQGLGEWATGMTNRIVLWNDSRPPQAPATARQPLLILNDAAAAGIAPKAELGPWQTQVTVLRQLGADNAHALQGANLVMLQRLTAPEAAVAGSALNLPANGAELLQEMTPEMLALMGSGANRYVWLAPTSVEQQYHGPPQR